VSEDILPEEFLRTKISVLEQRLLEKDKRITGLMSENVVLQERVKYMQQAFDTQDI